LKFVIGGEVVERRMAFNVETVGTKEFIVVFKFSTEEGTEFYVMKRIVRIYFFPFLFDY